VDEDDDRYARPVGRKVEIETMRVEIIRGVRDVWHAIHRAAGADAAGQHGREGDGAFHDISILHETQPGGNRLRAPPGGRECG
jgi:hypothetical protein